jgi:hypothetical protein
MARIEEPSEAALASIAQQIGGKFPASLAKQYAREAPPALAETLPVLMLPFDNVERGERFRDRLKPTDLWHHQIRRADVATDYANSVGPDENGEWHVVAVGRSNLPANLDRALTVVERRAKGDPWVRLVLIPAYQSAVLWLEQEDGDEIVVVTAPRGYSGLQKPRIFPGDEFLTRLAAYPPVEGVPPYGGREH